MNRIIMDKIPFMLDVNVLVDALRLKNINHAVGIVTELARDAMGIAKPKAFYKTVSADYPDEDHVEIEGIVLRSRLLKTNLCKSDIVLPFLCSCGTELEGWSRQFTDTLQKYWVDTILSFALGSAISALETSLRQRYHSRHLSMMNPGSLTDWPIQEQKNLFHLLGEDADAIGVTLTDGFMMKPIKSLSGIYFTSHDGFINCRHCSREVCAGRRASYQESPGHPADNYNCNA